MTQKRIGKRQIEVGDLISIPTWNTFGMVTELHENVMGDESDQTVSLQEDPESEETRMFRVGPSNFEFDD